MMHNYCEQEQFPSPPPPMEQVMEEWSHSFNPVQKEVESFGCLAKGKAVGQPMKSPQAVQNGGSRSASSPNASQHRLSTSSDRSGRSSSSQWHEMASPHPRSASLTVSGSETSRRPSAASSIDSSSFVALPEYFQSPGSFSQTGPSPGADYFSSRERHPSTASSPSVSSVVSSAPSASVIGKKKPPPPPPKPKPASAKIQLVTAQYDFSGQNAGDLSFKEGDRIRVLKKTDSTDEWWQGELRGVQGSFPANYTSA